MPEDRHDEAIPDGVARRRVTLRRSLALLTACGLLGVSGLLGLLGVIEDQEAGRAAEATGPNVVVVMTDDQTVESLRVMPKLRRLVQRRGTTFENSFATYPYCCPSRATFLTGQYAHNHGVAEHYEDLDDSRTLPVWLHRAGYRTAHVGKYVNGYGVADPRTVPPGWDRWYATTNLTDHLMFGYDLNVNGRVVRYGRRASEYKTDVFADITRRLVRSFSRRDRPFFLSVAPVAPHRDTSRPTAVPAPRHRGDLAGEELPRPPSFNEREVSDKPRFIRRAERLRPAEVAAVERSYVARLESLLAVDDLIGALVRTLRATGELGDTVIIFTSDNGFFHGEHRIPSGKIHLYEESVRVPLVMRGPEIPEGARRAALVGNVDLAPTIVDLAGARAGIQSDGRSLTPLARDRGLGRERDLVLESEHYPDHRAYVGLRTRRYVYAEYVTGERELYDLRRDPHQLRSRHGDPRYRTIRAHLTERLRELRDCDGSACLEPR